MECRTDMPTDEKTVWVRREWLEAVAVGNPAVWYEATLWRGLTI